MKAKGLPALAASLAFATAWQVSPVHAAELEVSKEIIAVQLRKQGYECPNPQSAKRDRRDSKPDENAWILTCEGYRYRVQLIPKMAAKVEQLPDETQSEQAQPQTDATPSADE